MQGKWIVAAGRAANGCFGKMSGVRERLRMWRGCDAGGVKAYACGVDAYAGGWKMSIARSTGPAVIPDG